MVEFRMVFGRARIALVLVLIAAGMSEAQVAAQPGTIKWQASLVCGSTLMTHPAIGPDGTIYAAGQAFNPNGSLRGCLYRPPAAGTTHSIGTDGIVFTATS